MQHKDAPFDGVIYRLWPMWVSSGDLAKVTRSIALAMTKHDGQTRKYNGLPYVTHPIRVALAIATYPTAKIPQFCAALLHDTLEDTNCTDAEIVEASSEETLTLVKELTNTTKDMKKVPRRDRKKLDWERLSKVSFWAKILKMFDRADNLRDMVNAPVDFKRLYVEESLELLKAVGDADPHIAAQVKSAGDALYDWRKFPVSELLNKPDRTEIECVRRGHGFISTVEKDGVRGKLVVFKDKMIEVKDENENEFRMLRETGKCRDSF